MVHRLVMSGAGVEIVVDKAGSGKTFALAAAREAWEAMGVRVLGCSLAARAALELERSSGVPSMAVHRLLADLDHPNYGGLTPGSVLVVDDHVVCLRNDHRTGVTNGTRGIVVAAHPNRDTLDFLPEGRSAPISLGAAYLDGGWLDHGYAITAHKAQGLTCDATFVLADEGLYRSGPTSHYPGAARTTASTSPAE